MTDAEKLSTLTTAALYQSQLDTLTRSINEYKATLATLQSQYAAKKKQLDTLWDQLQQQVGSGS